MKDLSPRTVPQNLQVTFVVGTTASGKSSWALDQIRQIRESHQILQVRSTPSAGQTPQLNPALHPELRCAIVNCDSIQSYKGLVIGGAQPSPQDHQEAKHFLYSFMEKGSKLTVGEYVRRAHECLSFLQTQGFQEVFVVGGTGFYFQALERGLYPLLRNYPNKEKILSEIEAIAASPDKGLAALHREIASRDPEAAQRISPKDSYRVVRAVEILRSQGGRTPTQIRREFESIPQSFPYPLRKVGLRRSKEELRERILERTQEMLRSGLIEEVQTLIAEGFRDWSALQSVGYREVLLYLDGGITSKEKLKEAIVQSTLKLTKRQKTWFQRDAEIDWI